ncbi:MAG: hypothetical protein II817_03355 [Bacteroidales bacterium]|nr:hypothetical protein [Bacteroidales bacterium]
MKKILFTIAIVMTMGICANAQNDVFFKNWNNMDDNRTGSGIGDITPANPGGGIGEYTNDQPAPLGGGLLILTALGAGYALARKKVKSK